MTPSVQRAIETAVSEAVKDVAVSDSNASLLHMPQLEVATEQTGTPGYCLIAVQWVV